MASIGENIKRLREENGWSQAKLGKYVGRTRSAISQYEKGETIPRMGVIEKIAQAFNVKKSEIIENGIEAPMLSAYEQEMVDIMRTLSPEGIRQLMIYARGVAQTYPKNTQVLGDKTA